MSGITIRSALVASRLPFDSFEIVVLAGRRSNTSFGPNRVNIASSAQTNQITVPVIPANGAVFFRLVRP
jgi:hypothetical protein